MKAVVISSTRMHCVVDSWVFYTLLACNRLLITVAGNKFSRYACALAHGDMDLVAPTFENVAPMRSRILRAVQQGLALYPRFSLALFSVDALGRLRGHDRSGSGRFSYSYWTRTAALEHSFRFRR